jgi:hypothetical protein
VQQTSQPPDPAGQAVNAAIAAGFRRRRARETSRRVWRAAPFAAAAALGVAAAAHLGAWPAIVPLIAIGAGAAALLVFALVARRGHPVTDAAVHAMDADAGMGGELRSAAWFAAREPRDLWADFHVQAAAERVAGIRWVDLYPAPRTARARLLTAGLTAAALALAATVPERVGARTPAAMPERAPAPAGRAGATPGMLIVPPELQRRLQELLAAVEQGNTARARELADSAELQEMLNRLSQLNDAELLEALARAMSPDQGANRTAAQALEELAERARNAAAYEAISPEMQTALEKLADELELEIVRPETGVQADGADSATPDAQGGDAGAQAGGTGGAEQVSLQFSEQTDGGTGMGIMMSSPEEPEGAGAPGGGFGGGSSPGFSQPSPEIETALRQEIVEARDDSAGARVHTEMRRRTEEGDAQVSFSGAATRTFNPARAVIPPPVPEARRPGVQTYFTRKP